MADYSFYDGQGNKLQFNFTLRDFLGAGGWSFGPPDFSAINKVKVCRMYADNDTKGIANFTAAADALVVKLREGAAQALKTAQ